jgi:hypothetical protein
MTSRAADEASAADQRHGHVGETVAVGEVGTFVDRHIDVLHVVHETGKDKYVERWSERGGSKVDSVASCRVDSGRRRTPDQHRHRVAATLPA